MSAVKAGPNIAFMMNFVCDFIDERIDRLAFELDFYHNLNERYDKMHRENSEAAEIFAEHIGEVVDRSDKLSKALPKILCKSKSNKAKDGLQGKRD